MALLIGPPTGEGGGDPLILDASHGEGGGQILRTALGLAVALGRPVTLSGIRLRRRRPGLQPQHLTVVRALAAVADAEVDGDRLDSTEVRFAPRALRAGEYRFDIGAIKGSAGSVTLLFQSLLLPLALAGHPSRLTLIGGTHVPWSPPVHYVTEVFLPALALIGIEARVELRRWGWYPAGGGEIIAEIAPAGNLRPLTAAPAGLPMVTGLSAVSRLPRSIAERQRARARARLSAAGLVSDIAVEEDRHALSAGTFLFLAVRDRAGFSALGRRRLPAEQVADLAVDELLAWRTADASLDDHLADQLLGFLALAPGPSAFTCPTLSPHLRTVAWALEQFLPVRFVLTFGPPARVEVLPSTPARARRPGWGTADPVGCP